MLWADTWARGSRSLAKTWSGPAALRVLRITSAGDDKAGERCGWIMQPTVDRTHVCMYACIYIYIISQ